MKPNKDWCPEKDHIWCRVWKYAKNFKETWYCQKCWKEKDI